MSNQTINIITVVVLIVAFLGVAAFFMLRAFFAQHYDGKPVPGYYATAQYEAPRDVTGEDVCAHLRAAESAIIMDGPWTAGQVAACMMHVQVLVTASEKWDDGYGGEVAGQELGALLVVNHSMTALCHEAAHLCETTLTGHTDTGGSGGPHPTWQLNGLYKAINAYEAWCAEHEA